MVKKAGGGSVPKGAKGISDKRPEPSPRPTSASPKKGRQEVSARDRLADLEAVAETLDAHAERQADVQSWPEWVERSPAEDQVLAAAAQVWELAARLPNFARAKSLLDQGRTVCALDQAGRVLAEFPGTRSEAAAAGWWASYPDTLPAAVCSPEADLFCLDVGHPRGGGVGWLQQACWEPPPAGYVRDEEEFEHRPPGWQLDHLGANVSLVEEVPPRPRLRRVMMSPPMTRSQRDAAYRALRPLSPPARLLLVWTYPEQGRWRLPKPGTHIGSEIRVLAALPAEGVTVVMGGPNWRVANAPQRILPLPDYLARALGGKCVDPDWRKPVPMALDTSGQPA